MSGRCLLLSLECTLHMHVCACTCTHVQRRHQHLLLLPLSHMHSYLSTSRALHPPPQHHHHSIIFMGRPFPLPPPPMCTQLTAHSATPSSLPDNTARPTSHNIHAHAPHTFIHSSAFSSLLAEMPEQCERAHAQQSCSCLL